jgi:hypothetical protein
MSGATIDLRADLHGHAIEYACGLDRAWFDAHPGGVRYHRRPVEHEWCLTGDDGQCVPLVPGYEIVGVAVRQHCAGLRTRQPIGRPIAVPAQ